MASKSSRISRPTTILPTVRYRQLGTAVAWLEKAFNFEVRSVEAGPDGNPTLAHMTVGNASLLLASVDSAEATGRLEEPQLSNFSDTQSCYVVVPDINAHFKRAVAAGCTPVVNLHDTLQSNRYYSCQDCEGHIWTFGVIDPTTDGAGEKRANAKRPTQSGLPIRALSMAVGLLAMIATSVTAGWQIGASGLKLQNSLADMIGVSQYIEPSAGPKIELATTPTEPVASIAVPQPADNEVQPLIINDNTSTVASRRSLDRYKERMEAFELVRLHGKAGKRDAAASVQPALDLERRTEEKLKLQPPDQLATRTENVQAPAPESNRSSRASESGNLLSTEEDASKSATGATRRRKAISQKPSKLGGYFAKPAPATAASQEPQQKKPSPPRSDRSTPHMTPMLSRCGETTGECRKNSVWCGC